VGVKTVATSTIPQFLLMGGFVPRCTYVSTVCTGTVRTYICLFFTCGSDVMTYVGDVYSSEEEAFSSVEDVCGSENKIRRSENEDE
jgi:hypothetical protein